MDNHLSNVEAKSLPVASSTSTSSNYLTSVGSWVVEVSGQESVKIWSTTSGCSIAPV